MSKLTKASSSQLVKKLTNCTAEEAVEINAILVRRGIIAETAQETEATTEVEVKQPVEAVAVEALSYYQKNKEAVKEYHKKYHEKNKEAIHAYHSKRYQAKKEEVSQYNKEYYQKTKEARAEYHKEYYARKVAAKKAIAQA